MLIANCNPLNNKKSVLNYESQVGSNQIKLMAVVCQLNICVSKSRCDRCADTIILSVLSGKKMET